VTGLKQWAAYIGAALVFGGLCFLAGHYLWKESLPSPAIASGDFQRPAEGKPVIPVVPADRTPDEFRGTLRVTVRDTVKREDTVGTVKEHEITVLIPKEDTPPLVSPAKTVEAVYSEIPEPIVQTSLSLVVGVSVGEGLKPSPFIGVQFFRLFNAIELGVGLNKEGLGPFLGYEFFREFSVFAQWNAVKLPERSKFHLGIAYRF